MSQLHGMVFVTQFWSDPVKFRTRLRLDFECLLVPGFVAELAAKLRSELVTLLASELASNLQMRQSLRLIYV